MSEHDHASRLSQLWAEYEAVIGDPVQPVVFEPNKTWLRQQKKISDKANEIHRLSALLEISERRVRDLQQEIGRLKFRIAELESK